MKSQLILTPKEQKDQEQIRQHGRVIAQGIEDVKVEKQKNMAKAEKRKETILSNAAERALSGR